MHAKKRGVLTIIMGNSRPALISFLDRIASLSSWDVRCMNPWILEVISGVYFEERKTDYKGNCINANATPELKSMTKDHI